jgi:CRISPR-associated protein Csm5
VAWLRTDDPAYREIIARSGLYGKSPYPGFPFPKTRRVVFLEDRPAALPGWGVLEVSD